MPYLSTAVKPSFCEHPEYVAAGGNCSCPYDEDRNPLRIYCDCDYDGEVCCPSSYDPLPALPPTYCSDIVDGCVCRQENIAITVTPR